MSDPKLLRPLDNNSTGVCGILLSETDGRNSTTVAGEMRLPEGPMTQESDFTSALKKGLGRAMILLRKNPANPVFQVELMRACKANLVYDPQCEARRAPYLCSLIREAGQSRFYWDKLLQFFGEAEGERSETNQIQMFEILCNLASDDPSLDRNTLRTSLHSVDFDTVANSCMRALVRLEGIAGLKFCFCSFASKVSPEEWVFQSIVSELAERDGKEVARARLREARERDPELDRLMRMAESTEQTNEKIEPILDRATVKELFAQGQHIPYTWGRDASAEDLEWAADELLAAVDDKQTISYLRQFFWKRDFPKPAASLIHLAHSQNECVASAAVRALSRIGDPDVRRLALELMSNGKRAADGVLLLQSNWQPGDFVTIERVLAVIGEDEFEYHKLGCAILDVLDHAPVPPSESNDTLLQLYENDPCSECRRQVASNLFASGNMPDWMAEECRYDAEPGIAALFNPA